MNITAMIDEAKETMLTRGTVMPMIYLELTDQLVMLALDILSDEQSIPVQAGILARLGWEECKKYPGQKPVAACMYAEAWHVKNPENIEATMMPVNSTKKQEVIFVQAWQVEKPQWESYSLPVIRDHKHRVVDVGPVTPSHGMISHQFEAFIHGTADAQKPDSEVFAKLEDRLSARLANLTDEQKRKLEEDGRERARALERSTTSHLG